MSSAEPVHVDPAPFDLVSAQGSETGPAALCLHGLTGTPYEVRPLAEALVLRGVRAVGPVLPGHSEGPEVLARCHHLEWLEAARGHLRALRERHDLVFGVGVSMGGLLCLALAAEEGEGGFDALAVVATPLRLRAPIPQLVPWVKHLRPFLSKTAGSDIRDPAARARHPSLDRMPLASVHELTRLQRRVRGELDRVRVPILIAHGVHDRTAHPDDARAIEAGVGSTECEVIMLEDSGHVVPVDYDGPELARAVAEFLARFG